MKQTTHPRTISEYITDNIVEIQTTYLELNNFVMYEKHRNLCYDKQAHRFKPQSEQKVYNYTIELKAAMEDIIHYSHHTLAYLRPLLKELNNKEAKQISTEFHRLIHLIDNCHQHLLLGIKHASIPEVLKSGLAYMAESLKNVIRECEVLEIELFAEEVEHDLHQAQESAAASVNKTYSENEVKKVLQEITDEVDDTLARLPFSTSGEERKRVIEERFNERMSRGSSSPIQAPGGLEVREEEWE